MYSTDQTGYQVSLQASNAVVSNAPHPNAVQYVLQTILHTQYHGQVKLLRLLLLSPPCPNMSPLSPLGSLAFAQHCIATRLMRSISSLSSRNCLFASLLFLSLTPFSSVWACMYCNPGVVKLRLPPMKAVRSATGDDTRDSRFTHSAIRAWMPAESCVARESRYGQWSGPQKGSEARASRRAGRMWGRGGRARDVEGSSLHGVVAGVATDDVERRDAAIVRRRWDSVLRVADVMHAMLCQYGV